MSWLDSIMGVVKVAAPIAANIVLPGSGSIVGGLMDSVLKSTVPEADLLSMTPESKAELIAKNPELMAKLQEKALELEAKIFEAQVQNMGQVAEVQKDELRHGNWWQKGWRPWNGYLFPIAVLAIYVGIPIWNAYHPLAIFVQDVPDVLWMIWGGVLGIAVAGRNKEKTAGLPASAPGLIGGLINKLTK